MKTLITQTNEQKLDIFGEPIVPKTQIEIDYAADVERRNKIVSNRIDKIKSTLEDYEYDVAEETEDIISATWPGGAELTEAELSKINDDLSNVCHDIPAGEHTMTKTELFALIKAERQQ